MNASGMVLVRRVSGSLHLLLAGVILLAVCAQVYLIWLSLGLAVIGTVQVTLASETEWVGALHPLLAVAVLALCWLLLQRGLRRQRA